MVRRLFTPKWILVHVGVCALVVLMVNLGFWQLRRLDEKRTFNATVSARTVEPVAPLDAVLTPDGRASDAQWRRVTVTGTYEADGAVTIVNRSQDSTAGVDSLVPLRMSDNRVVLVSRGFVPLALAVPAPPTGTVEVTGYLRTTQTRTALGAVDSTDPSTTEFQRFDVQLIARRVSGDVVPMWIQLIAESPSPANEWPARVPLPELTEGPHLSYAIQWFFFSLTAVTAWVVVVRRRLRETTASAPTTTE